MHDRDLNIIRANMAYMEYSGKSFNDILGRPYYSIFPLMERPFESCLNALKKEEEEITISSINKTFKVRSYPVKDTAGRLVDSVHLLEDITAARDFGSKVRRGGIHYFRPPQYR